MKRDPGLAQVANRIIEASIAEGVQDRGALIKLSRKLNRGRTTLPATADLRQAYDALVKNDPTLARPKLAAILNRRAVRSLSGVAVVTVLTKPYPCPGECVYCPSEARMPKSYLANEPAAARALALEFDPWRQVTVRLQALANNGHPNDKIELIVKGGTWSAYPKKYQDWFIKRCFDAANDFSRARRQAARTLDQAKQRNERAGHRIIGLTLETRPDRITPVELKQLRRLGCTRIEMGVQSLDDQLLATCRRGHDTAAVARATELLRNAGFKVDYHLMPQLPGSTPARDLKWLRQVFADPRFRPDMIKLYPCVVIKTAELYDWWQSGKYRPYSDQQLIKILVQYKQEVPEYCRISRLIRDIPSVSVLAGNRITNLRQTIQRQIAEQGGRCRCLRCREIGHAGRERPELYKRRPHLFDTPYETAGGLEHFLSFEDRQQDVVFAFCRLRLPSLNPAKFDEERTELVKQLPEVKDAAFIRELHTYGHLVPIGARERRASQHSGLGKRLMRCAEKLVKAAGYRKLAVIAGIGVRDYYRKLGYRRQGEYMCKPL
jgi:elongator complex protein 3